MNSSDAFLLKEIQSGEESDQSIKQLYQDHFEALSKFVLRNHGSMQDAEDVFQEVLIKFIELLKKNKFERNSGIGTFLYAINRHIWLNELKKRIRKRARDKQYSELPAEAEKDSISLLDHKRMEEQIKKLLDLLDETCKKVLFLSYYRNLSLSEMTAHFKDTSMRGIRNKKCRCERQLKRILSNDIHLKRSVKKILLDAESD